MLMVFTGWKKRNSTRAKKILCLFIEEHNQAEFFPSTEELSEFLADNHCSEIEDIVGASCNKKTKGILKNEYGFVINETEIVDVDIIKQYIKNLIY